MKGSGILSALALASFSAAQTPAGFEPVVEQKLEVAFGTKSVTPGLALAKTDTARQPTIGLSTPADGTYLWMMIGELPSLLSQDITPMNDSEVAG